MGTRRRRGGVAGGSFYRRVFVAEFPGPRRWARRWRAPANAADWDRSRSVLVTSAVGSGDPRPFVTRNRPRGCHRRDPSPLQPASAPTSPHPPSHRQRHSCPCAVQRRGLPRRSGWCPLKRQDVGPQRQDGRLPKVRRCALLGFSKCRAPTPSSDNLLGFSPPSKISKVMF